MFESELVRAASLKASGADIHEVQNLISAYCEAREIAADPESHEELLWDVFHGKRKALHKWAKKYEGACERSLRAYVAGVPVRHAARYSWFESRKIRSVRALRKVAGRRMRRFCPGF